MTPEDKQLALNRIADFERLGGAWLRRQAARLRNVLETTPGEFWDSYFTVVNQASPEAAALVRSGTVTTGTTFAQLREILQRGGDAQ